MELPIISRTDVASKRVLVRADIDIPITKIQDTRLTDEQARCKIQDDTRLQNIWPTIAYLLDLNCTLVLCGHLGRPGGKVVPELSSRPVAQWFAHKMGNVQSSIEQLNNVSPMWVDGPFRGFSVSDNLVVLENLRFDPREEENPSTSSGQADEYARELAGLADVYANEAFATCYEPHASIVGVPKFLPHFAGFRLAKEVEVLSSVLENPKRPLTAIIAGAKLDTKLPVITKMAEVADTVIVGGKLAEEYNVSSIMYKGKITVLETDQSGKDISLNTLYVIHNTLAAAATIVWNGPLGQIEDEKYQAGTKRLAELILANTSAYKFVGGGDTVAFLDKLGVTDKFDWVSSGGGSMLKFLAGERLPGIQALLLNYHKRAAS